MPILRIPCCSTRQVPRPAHHSHRQLDRGHSVRGGARVYPHAPAQPAGRREPAQLGAVEAAVEREAWTDFYLPGLWMTIKATIVAVVGAVVFGLVFGVGRLLPNPLVRGVSA